ncbi:hypothetical protein [Amycolatopsis sp. CM201R]|nr:hypothetical protein [Amycolatopsis sp. CM201R]
MCAGGRTVDQLRPDELVLPLVVIDLSAEPSRRRLRDDRHRPGPPGHP